MLERGVDRRDAVDHLAAITVDAPGDQRVQAILGPQRGQDGVGSL